MTTAQRQRDGTDCWTVSRESRSPFNCSLLIVNCLTLFYLVSLSLRGVCDFNNIPGRIRPQPTQPIGGICRAQTGAKLEIPVG